MIELEIENPLKQAARVGLDEYQPTFRGVKLAAEAQQPDASLNNLRHILNTGPRLTWAEVVEKGHIYLAFDSGEAYLATGFGVGGIIVNDERKPDAKLNAFSKFLSDALKTDQEFWQQRLTDLYSPDYRGLIDLNTDGDDIYADSSPIKLL